MKLLFDTAALPLATFMSMARYTARGVAGIATHSRMIDGIRWSWCEAGSHDAPPVVMLHGFAGDKDNWAFFAALLASRYRVICPDLPGFGDSGRAPDGDYSIPTQARRVEGFLDAIGITSCHLGGNSMGGFVALTVALDDAARLRSLLLMNNAGVNGEEMTDTQLAMLDGANPMQPRTIADIDALLGTLLHDPPYVPLIFRELLLLRLSRRAELHDAIFEQIVRNAIEHPLNDRLCDIRVPTLILWGRSDELLHIAAATAQHDAIPDSELVILDRAGHVPMIERPFRTASVSKDFIARHDHKTAAHDA